MDDLNYNHARITFLWILAIIAFFGYTNLASHEIPSILSNISLVTDQEVASITIVMIALAFLSLILKGSTNRLTNIIGGSVVGLGTFIVLIDAVTVNLYGFYNLMMLAVVIIMVSIIWFAYKLPKT